MIHDTKLLDALSDKRPEQFHSRVFRATGLGYDPTNFSSAGGRWMPRSGMAVLYTSLEREGALAEMSFRLGMYTPVPSKPIVIHTLDVSLRKVLRIRREDFAALDIDADRYPDLDYHRTEAVGEVIGFLEHDGIIVPSARWNCDNLVLISDHLDLTSAPTVVSSEQVDWLPWAKSNGFAAKS